jgi:hypothetical protein
MKGLGLNFKSLIQKNEKESFAQDAKSQWMKVMEFVFNVEKTHSNVLSVETSITITLILTSAMSVDFLNTQSTNFS